MMKKKKTHVGAKPSDPIDVVDGIPMRSSSPAMWKYAAIFAVFVAWVAFLVYCQLAGNP